MTSANPKYAIDFEEGTLFDYVDPSSGLRALVRRSRMGFCAYVGAQREHVMSSIEDLTFPCHKGITFESWGDGEMWPTEWYWWGWDYCHYGDKLALPPEEQEVFSKVMAEFEKLFDNPSRKPPKNWSFEEVKLDVLDVLTLLSEAVQQANRASGDLLKGVQPNH